MDKLIIESLRVQARVGVTAAERQVGQWLDVSAEVAYDLAAAGRSDDISETISYAEIARIIHDAATERQFMLLEALAESMAQRLMVELGAAEVRLRLLKRPPPMPIPVAAAGVEIVRRRA